MGDAEQVQMDSTPIFPPVRGAPVRRRRQVEDIHSQKTGITIFTFRECKGKKEKGKTKGRWNEE